jgi:hypothetical protein
VTGHGQPDRARSPSSAQTAEEGDVAVRWWRRRGIVLVGGGAVLAMLVAGFAVALGATAREGGSSGGAGEVTAVAPAMPARPAPGVPRYDVGADGSVSKSDGGMGESAAAAPEARSAPVPGVEPAQVPVGGVQRALVRTAQLTVEVGDPAGTMRQVRTAAAAAGGFVTDEQTSDTGSWVTLRVPADALDRLVEDIAASGRVTGRSTQVFDATEESIDLDARVASQQASVARVRALLAQAESIGDVVAIESELSRREADLDSLTRRLESLRDQVAMSTLTVDLRGPAALPPPGGPAPGFRDGLATGWAGLLALGSGVAAAVGFVLPFLPVVAVLAGIVWLLRRIVRGRRRPAAAAPSAAAPDD